VFGSSFIQDNWVGNKIVSDLLDACNITVYKNNDTGETYSIPFVPCGQLYVLDEPLTVLGQNLAITGV